MTLKEIVTQWATNKLAEEDAKLAANLMLGEIASDTGQTLYELVDDVIKTKIIDVGHPTKALVISKTGAADNAVDLEIIDITRPA